MQAAQAIKKFHVYHPSFGPVPAKASFHDFKEENGYNNVRMAHLDRLRTGEHINFADESGTVHIKRIE
jgi:hypothetical protein